MRQHGSYRPIGWTRRGRPIWPIAGGNGNGSSSGAGSGSGGGDGGGSGSSGSGGGDGGSGGSGAGGSDGGSGSGSGSGGSGSGSGGGAGDGDGSGGDGKGFPADTPVAEMTPEQQASYWKHHARKHEQRAKEREDYDAVKAERDRLKTESMTDAEKAADDARKEGRTEGIREAGGKMVEAHVRAAVTAGRLTDAQADALLDGLDRTKYLTEDGDVDTGKVKTLLDSIAPAKGNGHPDLGQGRRPAGGTGSDREAGRDEARRRFGDRARSASK